MPRIFCFGLGYCATRLNEALVVDGWEVAGTKRSKIDLANVFLFDGRGPVEQTSTLKKTTHLLSSFHLLVEKILFCNTIYRN